MTTTLTQEFKFEHATGSATFRVLTEWKDIDVMREIKIIRSACNGFGNNKNVDIKFDSLYVHNTNKGLFRITERNRLVSCRGSNLYKDDIVDIAVEFIQRQKSNSGVVLFKCHSGTYGGSDFVIESTKEEFDRFVEFIKKI